MKKIGMVLSAVAIFMASCSVGSNENSYLGVKPNQLTPKAAAGESSFKIFHTHAVSLSVQQGGDWCTVSPMHIGAPANGFDSTAVTVTYTANTTDKARQTEVLFKAGELDNYVIVKQAAPVVE